jgi:hypothetical protein
MRGAEPSFVVSALEEGKRETPCFGIKRTTIAQHQRGLKWKNGRFEPILEPGVVFDPFRRSQVELFDLSVAELERPKASFLLTGNRAIVDRHFDAVEKDVVRIQVPSAA